MAGSPSATATYLQLGKARTPSKKGGSGTLQSDGNVLVEEQPLQSPYEFFYPEEQALASPTKDGSSAQEAAIRLEIRKKRQNFFSTKATTFKRFESGSNLIVVHKAFMTVVNDEGTLTKANFNRALQSLNITDESLMDRAFELFDANKEGIVDYEEVISALDVIVNGTNKHITAKDCFSLVDPTSCGYIIMNWLQELKHKRTESNEVTHMMVKTLLEIFDRLQLEEEERIMKERNKKGKKGKAEAAGPITWSKKIHLNFTEFSSFLAAEPLLVQAFLTRVLQTMEAVYIKNKSAVTAQSSD